MQRFFAVAASRASLLAGLLLSATVLWGCGSGEPAPPATGEISGKVTYNGAAPKNAMIMFYNPNGKQYISKIGEDGSYAIPSLDAVEYKVGVGPLPAETVEVKLNPDGTPPTGEPIEPPKPPPPTNVPEKYHKVGPQNELKATVAPGKNPPIDFTLTD